jgi:hypothetical protein
MPIDLAGPAKCVTLTIGDKPEALAKDFHQRFRLVSKNPLGV